MKNEFTYVKTGLNGQIQVPGDKSISHRSIMFGAIANGITEVENFLPGEDCLSTISCFRKLGVEIEQDGSKVRIKGAGNKGLKNPSEVLDVGNSGTTIRLMLGLLSALGIDAELIGDASIAKRPMKRVVAPLREMGANITGREDGNFTPLTVQGRALKGISYTSKVASAQVKSAILLAGLYAEGMTSVTEPYISRDHTERMLKYFGGDIKREGKTVHIQGGQHLTGQKVYVPSDISSAAFWMVAGLIVPNSHIRLTNVGLNPTRDGVIEVLQNMGANLQISDLQHEDFEAVGTIDVKSTTLHATEIGGAVIPRLIDEIPVLALLATQAKGVTVIKDAKELKVKETNRIDTVVNELRKMGADIEATEDGMRITGPTPLYGAEVSSHGDHRIGMMLIVASMLATGTTKIDDIEAVAVSYPSFLEDYAILRK